MVAECLKCPACGKQAAYSKYCGAHVCECGQHFHKTQLLVMCFCGWGVKNDIDRAEMGMNEDRTFDGDFWEVNY
jgi:hypothetical protein